MKLLLTLLLGVLTGLLTSVLLPFLFVIVLQTFIISTREPLSPSDAVQCDGGEDGDVIIRREALLPEYPIPPAFEAWWKEQAKKGNK